MEGSYRRPGGHARGERVSGLASLLVLYLDHIDDGRLSYRQLSLHLVLPVTGRRFTGLPGQSLHNPTSVRHHLPQLLEEGAEGLFWPRLRLRVSEPFRIFMDGLIEAS